MQTAVPQGEPRIVFWSSADRWPDDVPQEHMFLGRVVHIVGHVVFGADWTGSEPTVELIAPVPADLHASVPPAELQRGCRLLFDHHKPYAATCPEFAEFLLNWPIPSKDEWRHAVDLSRHMAEQRWQTFSRYIEVCSRLANAFKQGTISTAAREVDGGSMLPQDRWFWNTENFWSRFYTCRVDVFDPYRAATTFTGGYYIYVDQASLMAALQPSQRAVQAPAQPEVTAEEYLSPYLRCMISATRALGITAEDKRKRQDIVVELPKHWTGSPGDLSAEDIERMATLMREPAHKGGRKFKARL